MDLAGGWASSGAGNGRQGIERWGRWLLAVAILGSALGLGALHTPVLAAVAVVATVATALLWWDASPLEPRPAATVLVATAVVLIAWTVLQVVPLPRGALSTIAGENANVWSRCLHVLKEPGPSLATLSLSPVQTRVQVLRGVTYLVVFLGALRVARRQEGVVFLERTLLVSTLATAGAALVHPALGARKVFGIYEPVEKLGFDVNHVAPLLNTNHLAAYVNIGVLLAFASVIERREALPRPPALAIVLLLGATTVWTLSRGGTAAMALGVVLVALLTFGARRAKRGIVAGPLVLVGASALGGLVFLLSAFDSSRAKFAQNDLSKITLVKNAFALVSDHPLFGVGRGAFESAFPKVRTGTGYWVATHPENVVAQWTTEWGVPVAVAAMFAIAWALRPQTALARSRPPAGPWAVLVAVTMHNLVDFNSEVPGVIVALATCAAMVTGGTGGGRRVVDRAARWAARPRLVAIGAGVLTLLAVGTTLPFTARELYAERRTLRDAGLDRSLPREAFHAHARTAMLDHPAEPYFPFVGAVRATAMRDESVLPWAGRALERSPVYGRVHLLLARSLFTRSAAQARLEYRTACEQDETLCAPNEALPLVRGYDDAMELVPEGEAGLNVLNRLPEALEARLPSSVARIDRDIAARNPTALGPVVRAASRVLGDIKDGEAWCAGTTSVTAGRAACITEGLEAAARLRAAAPSMCEGHALAAELRVAAGEIDAGYAELDHSLEEVTERSPCARRLVRLAVQTGNAARIDAALDRLLKLGCEAPGECVANFMFAADVEQARGSGRRALALTKKAWERAPERDDILADVAGKAEGQGLHGEALDAYTKLAERHPDEPRWKAAAERERQAVTRGVFQRR